MTDDEGHPEFSEQELASELQRSLGGSDGHDALGSTLEGALQSAITDELLTRAIAATIGSQPMSRVLAQSEQREQSHDLYQAAVEASREAIGLGVSQSIQRAARGAVDAEQLQALREAAAGWVSTAE